MIIGKTDSKKELIVDVAEGNPGALAFCMELLKIDPAEGFYNILRLKRYKVTGPKAYMLWNDCCGRNTKEAAGVLKECASGRISPEELREHVDRPWGLKFDMEEIMARKPQIRVPMARIEKLMQKYERYKETAEQHEFMKLFAVDSMIIPMYLDIKKNFNPEHAEILENAIKSVVFPVFGIEEE